MRICFPFRACAALTFISFVTIQGDAIAKVVEPDGLAEEQEVASCTAPRHVGNNAGQRITDPKLLPEDGLTDKEYPEPRIGGDLFDWITWITRFQRVIIFLDARARALVGRNVRTVRQFLEGTLLWCLQMRTAHLATARVSRTCLS